MNRTDQIRHEAHSLGVEVVDWDFKDTRIKGLYCDGTIALSSRLCETEQTAVLAEELGHHLTAAGDILDQSSETSRKQELRGRIWAYNRLIGLSGILKAYKAGCRNRFEMADCLEVPEETLQEAIDYYHHKYGICTELDNYVICFEPLGVLEIYE